MSEYMNIRLPEAAEDIISRIEEAGYEAYIVGGCVRDALLGRSPSDWDITTSARPEQVKKLFRRTVDTGLKHGTVTVLVGDGGYEVTTYRIDGEYLDGRHPESVAFTTLLSEDLRRRDFTINAMAYHPRRGLVDLFEGQEDLKRGVIRCVGEARERFGEDALRMMRAVRFSAQLNFSIDDATREAARELAPNLKQVSHERIRDELLKLLLSDHPNRLLDLYELGLTAQFFPEFDQMMSCAQNTKYHCYTVGMHTLKVLEHVEPDRTLRLAAMLHDVGKLYTKTTDENGTDHFYGHAAVSERRAREFLHEMRFDNDTIRRVCVLVKNHDPRFHLKPASVRRLMSEVGTEMVPLLIRLMRADTMGKSAAGMRDIGKIDELEQLYHQIVEAKDCVSIRDLAVNGSDLIEAGIPRGAQIGAMLEKLLQIVLAEPEKNNRETLLALVRKEEDPA